LESLTHDALDARYGDVLQNVELLVCKLRDQVPIRTDFLSSWWWLKKKYHIECEYRLRKRHAPVLPLKWPRIQRTPPFAPSRPNEESFIVKYGEAWWLEPMLTRGRVRISPASRYKGETPEADAARHDDELRMHRYISSRGVTVTLMRTGTRVPILGDIQRTRSSANYYALCFSNEFDYSLFPAFPNREGKPADACLVVRNVDEFARRLGLVMSRRLPGWHYFFGSIGYYDPWHTLPKQVVSPGISKDFKYAYQREYRLVWHPLAAPQASDVIDIEIGSIEDIAELHLAG
jgi:hypothetical protein